MKAEFVIQRQGKSFVLYAGLLDLATERGLTGIEVEALQITATLAVFKATASFADGRRFSSHGDASPDNVGRTIAPHFIRMAETRSKARALRDALNIGAVALEELGPDADDQPHEGGMRVDAQPLPLVAAPRPIRPPAPPRPPLTAPLTPAAVAARHAEDAAGTVPSDDVEHLSGVTLLDACLRLEGILRAAELPATALPVDRERTNKNLRAWWHASAALLAARETSQAS